ncbi:MAG TPA: hypothetical protein VJJ72_00760 [Candidatus Paceibacterota bacterium]
MAKEHIKLNLRETPNQETPESVKDEETGAEPGERKISNEWEISFRLGEDMVERLFNETSLLRLNAPESFKFLSDEEREKLSEDLSAELGRRRLSHIFGSIIKKIGLSTIISAGTYALTETGIKVLIRQGYEIGIGPTYLPALIAGLTTGVGINIFDEVRRELRKPDVDDFIEKIKEEPDAVKRAALVMKAKDSLKNFEGAELSPDDKEKIRLLTYRVRAAVFELKKETKTSNLSARQKMEVLYLLDKCDEAQVEVPLPIAKKAEKIAREVRLKFQEKKLDPKRITMAALEGAIEGAIGTTVAYGFIQYLHSYIQPIAEGLSHQAQNLVKVTEEQIINESFFETGDRLMAQFRQRLNEIVGQLMRAEFTSQ